ncbi:hypothetical protein G195_006332 [Phytophthora kernoviae 00238/432]|uniref:Uncharacterized protein n=1 Tax=Phytophthora kernoviae 00238/432 TaxID=1284355 RepID=A0A8J4S845_9STRA|nr:hypothetical protein G195_006332 [Phytophthora kernoviae 00238/432]
MLRSLSIQPVVPIMGGDPTNHLRPEPAADIIAAADNRNGINAVLHVYLRPTSDPSRPLVPLEQRTPDYSIRCTFAELKKLRSQIQSSVGCGGHCAHCKRVATYMTYCWERPRLLTPSWQGGMTLQTEPLSTFLNQLLCFAAQLGPEAHPEFAAIVAHFMQPRDDVRLKSAVVLSIWYCDCRVDSSPSSLGFQSAASEVLGLVGAFVYTLSV